MPRTPGQPTIISQVRNFCREGRSNEEIVAIAQTLTNSPWVTIRNIQRIKDEINGLRPTVQRQATNHANDDFDNEMTFGVEIEFVRPRNISHYNIASKISEAGIDTEAESYNHNTRRYWKIVTDSSVHGHGDYVGRNEIVSPILKGQDGLNQVEKVCKTLEELGCTVNKSCGLHIHHGLTENVEEARDIIGNIVFLYKKYQSKFHAMLPASRRNKRWARNITPSHIENIKRGQSPMSVIYDRYHVINPQAYFTHNTIEFRQHSGTVEATKINNWVKITQKVVQRAKKMGQNKAWEMELKQFNTEFNFSRELNTYIKERTHQFRNVA